MALVYSQSWVNPTSTASVYMDTSRNGASVTITATVVCNMTYSSGYVNYNGEINFNMWCPGGSASANIKGYYDRWSAGSARTRTRTCSMTITSTGDSIPVGFNMTIPSDRPAGAAFRIDNRETRVGFPGYSAPSAPSWINATPNPCSITGRPVITWGGARTGTLGRLYYDVEVRSSKPGGGWTNWLRIANSQGGTSYNEIVLQGMNVHGQLPFAGVVYQYRVRSTDGSYTSSNWVTVTLNVGFNNPTPPTTYTFSNNSIKRDGSIIINWSGATAGTGTIQNYEVDYRIYNHKTGTWSNWIEQVYKGSASNFTFDLGKLYSVLDGTYIIQVAPNLKLGTTYNNLAWGIKDSAVEPATVITLLKHTDNTATNQQFKVAYNGDGFYKISLIHSDMNLDVRGGETANNTPLQEYPENGSDAQKWIIQEVEGRKGVYNIISKLSPHFSLYADIRNNTITENANVVINRYSGNNSQNFTLTNINGDETSGAVLANGDILQFRIRTINSWGQASSYLVTANLPVRGNQIWVKIQGTWVMAELYVKNNGAWAEATPYIKQNGVWYVST